MESAVANKIHDFSTICLAGLPRTTAGCLTLASLSVERRRLIESGATSLLKGRLIAAEAQPKGHRGSQSAAEVGRSSSDRNVIFFHSSNDAQVRHCAGAGAPPPGGLYKVHSLTAVKAGREAWCAALNTSPGLSPVDRYRCAWLWFLKRWYGERKKQQTLFARRDSFGREGRDSVHVCRCRPPTLPTPTRLAAVVCPS